jgi:hypothetical protein
MSSSVYIPSASGGGFTPPTSTTIKTGAYTVPAGKYAKVSQLERTVQLGNTFSFTNTSQVKTFTESELCLMLNGSRLYSASYAWGGTITMTAGSTGFSYTFILPTSMQYSYTSLGYYVLNNSNTASSYIGNFKDSYFIDGAGSATGFASYTSVSKVHCALKVEIGPRPFNSNYAATYRFNLATQLNQPSTYLKAGDVLTAPADFSYLVEEYTI